MRKRWYREAPRQLRHQRAARLYPPCSSSRGAQGRGLWVTRLLLEPRLGAGFSAGRVVWVWGGDLAGTSTVSVEEELRWKRREPVDALGCPALGACNGEKKTPNLYFCVPPPVGWRAGYQLSPGAGCCPPRRPLLPRWRVGTEPSAPVSQQDPLHTSPSGSAPPDGTGSSWQAPSARYDLSPLKGRILSSLLMFYAAWLHLQRKTLVAVNDCTSAVLRAE